MRRTSNASPVAFHFQTSVLASRSAQRVHHSVSDAMHIAAFLVSVSAMHVETLFAYAASVRKPAFQSVARVEASSVVGALQ